MNNNLRKGIDFIKNNYVLQIILFAFLFVFYIHVVNSIAIFFDIDPINYSNYMFFYSALIILYIVLPREKTRFLPSD